MRSTERNLPPSTIGRVSIVLACFGADESTLSLGELSRRTGIAKSTMSRITTGLVAVGFLERQQGGLALGLRLFEMGEIAARPKNLRRYAYSQMEHLRRRSGHTVHLAVLDGTDVVYIEILPSRTAPIMPSRVGGRVQAHATAVGKLLLAHAPLSVRSRLMSGPLEQVGPNTITDAGALSAAFEEVRKTGIAIERSESAAGVVCVAALVPLPAGSSPAAISVSGSEENFSVDSTIAMLRDAIRQLRVELNRLPKDLRSI